jgi:hypothetical protein
MHSPSREVHRSHSEQASTTRPAVGYSRTDSPSIHRSRYTASSAHYSEERIRQVNEDKLLRDTLIGATLLVVLVLMALFLALISGLRWYLSPDNALSIAERRDLVQGLALAGQAFAVFLTGAVGLIGLFFTWQNTRQARESSRRTLELTEQGQITDRFTKAIDQLGKTGDNDERVEEIRLGGIYALERIAVECPDSYHWPIMQVFAAYLRRHASWQGDPAQIITPTADVETVLHVIGHRRRYFQAGEDDRLSLARTDLSNYSFPAKTHLEGAILQLSHFESARHSFKTQISVGLILREHISGMLIFKARISVGPTLKERTSGVPILAARILGMQTLMQHTLHRPISREQKH